MPIRRRTDSPGTRARDAGCMTVHTDGFRKAHEDVRAGIEVIRRTARVLPDLTLTERDAAVDHVLDFMRETVLPHTVLDERLLYHAVAERLHDPLATASMSYDHLAIRRYAADIAEADTSDVATLQELLYGVAALMRIHIWKENELYLAPLESTTWPAAGS
jgi:hypothetical protein